MKNIQKVKEKITVKKIHQKERKPMMKNIRKMIQKRRTSMMMIIHQKERKPMMKNIQKMKQKQSIKIKRSKAKLIKNS
jgi:hypothetical protein